jgi:hypothetical protein
MLSLQIKNKEIESAFITKFNADKNKFISFIENSLKKLETPTDVEFQFSRLDPLENYHTLEFNDENKANLSNPFEKVQDTIAFSKKLRNSSYR